MKASKEDLKKLFHRSLSYGLSEIEMSYKDIKDSFSFWKLKKHDDYPEMDFFDSGIPRFSKSSYKKNHYTSLLTIDGKKHNDIGPFNEYYDLVKADHYLRNYYELDEKAKFTEDSEKLYTSIYSHILLSFFIERYIHLNNESFSFNQSLFDKLFDKWYNSVYQNPLRIDILIPLIFLDFEIDEIEIDENIFLTKIPDGLQLARNTQTSFTDSSNSIVVGGASHMLVLRNWTIPNAHYDSRRHSLYDINSYKTVMDIVNDFLCALRISTGLETGTSQILTVPNDWEDIPKADLPDVFFCSVRNYPSHFDDFGWLNKPSIIKQTKLEQTRDIYQKIRTTEKNNIRLAINRLNGAFLRSKEEDTILDTTIALETLITHDSKSEITYRLSSRIAALCSIEKFENYEQWEVFGLCKKVYSYRSDVIHGNTKKINKSRKIKSKDDKEIPTIQLSISLLRHVLKILLLNPQYAELEMIDKLKYKN